jgi:hypothetical protein
MGTRRNNIALSGPTQTIGVVTQEGEHLSHEFVCGEQAVQRQLQHARNAAAAAVAADTPQQMREPAVTTSH